MVVVIGAFACLLWDVVQPDHVMIGALAILMAAGVVSVEEGLQGFSNEGLLTVATLFVVAAGISATGGLDWYMSKLLGRPRTIAGAQLRLMVPIAFVSAFLNNTPVVAVMIPIVQRWAENIHIPKEQVMIPLSFASILGGTCTLIGTSTNLVVLGMLRQWRGADGKSERQYTMGLFDLGLYGVPCALTGMAYVLVASRALLPKGRDGARGGAGAGAGGAGDGGGAEDLIVGARLQPWSAAVGKTVAGSGLRGLPGLYLVSVKRDETLMRAVGPEFVLTQGDVLYFTGMVENLGTVCSEHGLEAMTAEHDESSSEEEDSPGTSDSEITAVTTDDYAAARHLHSPVALDLDGSPEELCDSSAASGFQSSKRKEQRPRGGTVPMAIPEMSELMEIQRMARSQAIGGVKGAWIGRKAGGLKIGTAARVSGCESSDGNPSGGDGSEDVSGGESEGFESTTPREESDGDVRGRERDEERDAVSSLAFRRSPVSGSGARSGDVGASSRSPLDARRTVSDGSPNRYRDRVAEASGSGVSGALRRRRRRSNAEAEFASAVSLDPGDRRALKLYEKRRRVSSSSRNPESKK